MKEFDSILEEQSRKMIREGGFKLVIKNENIKMTPKMEEYLEELRQAMMKSVSLEDIVIKGK